MNILYSIYLLASLNPATNALYRLFIIAGVFVAVISASTFPGALLIRFFSFWRLNSTSGGIIWNKVVDKFKRLTIFFAFQK